MNAALKSRLIQWTGSRHSERQDYNIAVFKGMGMCHKTYRANMESTFKVLKIQGRIVGENFAG
jgi:hypothetical protein